VIPAAYQAYDPVVTVGCVNFSPVWGDKKRTLAKIEANVVEAAAQGIDLLVFPEGALTGSSGCDDCRAEQGPCETHLELAEPVPGPATTACT
jgi:predicted amidohydrolase